MNSKKLFQIITILTAGIAIALTGTLIATKFANSRETTAQPSVITEATFFSEITTLITSTTIPRETVPIGGNSVITTVTETKPQWKVEEEASISASVSQSKAEASKKNQQKTTTKAYVGIVPQNKAGVISSFKKGLNNLKKTKKFSMQEDKGLTIKIDDITGGYLVKQTAESIIAQRSDTPVEAYVFENGADISSGSTPKQVIPPSDKYLELDESIVLSATAKATADGGYTATIRLKDEKQTSTKEAKNLSKVIPTFDLQELFSNGIVLDEYELIYSGASITALFDKNNRITYLEYHVPFTNASGSGSLSLVPFTVQLHGDYVATYDITY